MNEGRRTSIVFADYSVKKAYDDLRDDNYELYGFINRVFDELKENPTCGIHIQKRLIPKIYLQKYGVNNLWKRNLPRGWRLVYSLKGSKTDVVTIVLEWFDHKEYERRFNY